MHRILNHRVLRFLAVGGTATILQLILLIAMVELANLNKIVASAAAYALSALYNYLLNYHLTFNSSQSHWQTAPKFIAVVGLGLLVNTSVFAMLLHALPYLFAQFGAIGVALVVNFILHKYWIYKSE